MSAAADYGILLEEIKPQVPHADEQYQYLLERLSAFVLRENLSEAEEKVVELLTLLVREYERTRFEKIEKALGIDIVKYLMEHQGLKNKDLVPSVFETESVASAVLKGSRGLTLRHVKRLAERFNLSADVFISET
jgi:antitoxin component HigA of HigAB toxin-antitoxin module